MSGIYYEYENEDGSPMTACPFCGSDLTAEDSVMVVLTVGGEAVFVASNLELHGELVDTDDRGIWHGHHSSTSCRDCGQMLTEYEVKNWN